MTTNAVFLYTGHKIKSVSTWFRTGYIIMQLLLEHMQEKTP